MINPEVGLSCQLNSLVGPDLEQNRLRALEELGLLEAESVPIFDEATQTAAHFLDMPICVLGIVDRDREWLKSAVGLSRLGLMNELAASRQMIRSESFGAKVVENYQVLVISDASNDPLVSDSILVKRYRVRAYLGVPLMDSAGHCLGTLAVMDSVPRTFTRKEIEFLELTARWSMSEFERNRLVKLQQTAPLTRSALPMKAENAGKVVGSTVVQPSTQAIKVQLLAQLTQELRTPLTSIMGMASVLNREIYGTLTNKQKEYLGIVYQSGQYLLSLVNEVLELGALEEGNEALNLSSVDIEMLCQQVINTLEQAVSRREQQIQLTIEPGNRIWLLDKNKMRQMLYHLLFSVIQSSSASSILRLHVSRKQGRLNIAIWVSHPWLGDNLPYADLYSTYPSEGVPSNYRTASPEVNDFSEAGSDRGETAGVKVEESRESLGLLLSRQLAELQGGHITLQGSLESGYRYVISIPPMTEAPTAS